VRAYLKIKHKDLKRELGLEGGDGRSRELNFQSISRDSNISNIVPSNKNLQVVEEKTPYQKFKEEGIFGNFQAFITT